MRRSVTVLLLSAVLLSVGCGSSSDEVRADDDPAGTEPPTTTAAEGGAAALDGRTFVATSVTVDGAERALVDGTELRLDVQDGTLGLSAGCNGMSTGYRAEGSTLVTSGEVASTLVGCEAELQAQDEWIGELLRRDLEVDLAEDRLVLTAGDAVITLVDASATTSRDDLVGPTWTLDTLVEGDMARTVPVGVTATLTFADDGTYAVATGCNTGSGTFETADGTLTVTAPTLTKVGCKGDAASVEQAVLAVLDGEVAFSVTGDRLSLTAAEADGGPAGPGGAGLGLVAG